MHRQIFGDSNARLGELISIAVRDIAPTYPRFVPFTTDSYQSAIGHLRQSITIERELATKGLEDEEQI